MSASSSLDHFRARVLQDAIDAGLAMTWRRRQAAFEAARPRPGDFTGRATRSELAERWWRLTAIAEACGHRAELAERHDGIDPDVRDALHAELAMAVTSSSAGRWAS